MRAAGAGSVRAALWNARAALLYSLGGWSTLGALMYYNRERGDSTPENENDPQKNQGPRREVYVTDTPFGQVTTEVTYRDVQPPITRLLRRVVSFFFPDSSPPSEK